MGRKRLHDERLRQRLLDVAGERLATHGLTGLSLRTLATAAGTSTAAVYSLFGGKAGLLSAMHGRAFQRFGEGQRAVGSSADPVADLIRLGQAYRETAIADPNGYWIMFGGELRPEHVTPEVRAAATDTFLPLLHAVQRCVAEGSFSPDVPVGSIATALWANVHGLVSLELGGFLPPTAADPATVFDSAVRATLRGWMS